jgi:hypothetical protein
MANPKPAVNPFYVLCVLAGVAFTVTACAYGVMMLWANRGFGVSGDVLTEHPLMNLLDRYGMIILGVEVAVLVAVSVAAIMLDHYRGKRIKAERKL